MPKLSDTMTVGTLISWLKKEGDPVANGDMIAEVETDKATMEVECFEDGFLIKQYCEKGSEVAVGSPIAAIGEKEEAPPEIENSTKVSSNQLDTPNEIEEVNIEEPLKSNDSKNSRIKASPLAKKIADSKGVDLSQIKGSGPGGRIVKKDVESSVASIKQESNAKNISLDSLNIPISNMRRSIAKALVESKTQAPHFYLQIEMNASPLSSLRKELNDKLSSLPEDKGGAKFSINDLILRASAEAVNRVPEINRSWGDEFIYEHKNVHLAFGVAIEEGLVTPVIRFAESKSLRQISIEAKALINKAREKKLTLDEMSGATLTVTNLGMFGISDFYGIINPKNAAILSIGASIKKPIINDKGEIIPGEIMKIGLSGDHRVIDGAVAAKYLQSLKEIIENPYLMLL